MHVGMLSIFQNYRDNYDDADIVQGELRLALAAEEHGFDSYWSPEHHFFGYSMSPDNIQWLAQVGALIAIGRTDDHFSRLYVDGWKYVLFSDPSARRWLESVPDGPVKATAVEILEA